MIWGIVWCLMAAMFIVGLYFVEDDSMVEYCLICSAIFVLGIIIGVKASIKSPSGTIHVTNDEDGRYLFLEMDIPIEEMIENETVVLNIARK